MINDLKKLIFHSTMLKRIEDGYIIVTLNPEIYPISVIYSAAYVLMDRAYILLDGDLKKEIIVKLKPKVNSNIENLAGDFCNELINYLDYRERAKGTKEVRDAIYNRAIFSSLSKNE